MLPRKFKIAFEGCAEDHALASINDIGWRARIEDGRRGFRVTVAGGTSIMPVSGYVLYDFLPVEEMFERGRSGLRVFHRFGDYEHRQRNRLKFTRQGARLGRVPRAVRGGARRVRREGGAPLDADRRTPAVRGRARLDAGGARRRCRRSRRRPARR